MIEIKGVSKRYPNTNLPALDRFSLSIARGSFFGLLGPNGAGKTTLLSILCGILEPTGGTVEIEVDGQRLAPRAARAWIGYAPQDLAFYPTLTVRENLEFFARVHAHGGTALKERVDACLALGQLGPQRHKRAAALSGGLKRRLNLAIALLHDPPLVVLDEPTAGVDAQSRLYLQGELRRLRERGTTIVYSSHLLEEVEALCDSLAIIDQGRLVASGGTSALLGEPVIELRLARALPPGLHDRLASITAAHDLKAADATIVIACDEPHAALVRALDLLHVESIGVIEARLGGRSLETLFFQLTGTRLRDGDADDHAPAARLR